MKRMKTIVVFGMAILCTIILSGCGGGSGYKKADSTSGSMDALKAELLNGKDQIAKMIKALNQVVASANANPRPAYETFKKEFENTKKQAKKARNRADAMKKQGQAYFKTWEAEFKKVASPEVKQRFEQRKAEMTDKYQKIQEYSQQVKTDYDAFMQDLSDIQVVLGVDLTAMGIESIADTAAKATRDAQTIYGHIDTYVSILDEVSAAMRPSAQ